MDNNNVSKQMIPDATQWSYSNLTNKKRIPDTNKWIYTHLLKQKWISEATQWTYTNLLNKENESGYRMPIYLDLYQSPTKRANTWMSDANLSGLTLISNI